MEIVTHFNWVLKVSLRPTLIQKGGLWVVSFNFILSNDRGLCFYAPSGQSTREQLARERFFERLQNDIENKNEGNENKIILGEVNCTMNKID